MVKILKWRAPSRLSDARSKRQHPTPPNKAPRRPRWTRGWQSAYAERGLSDRATLIVDQGASPDGAFKLSARYARTLWPEADWASSWSLGAVWRDEDVGVIGGLAVGRGLEIAGRNAWVSGEFSTQATAHRVLGNADLTLGVTLDNGVKLYGQMLAEAEMQIAPPVITSNRPEVRLGLNAAIPLREGLLIDIGASHGIPQGGSKLKLGLWVSF